MDPDHCEDKRFFVEPASHHAEIILACIRLMENRLKKNICNLDDYAVLSEVKDLSTQKKVCTRDALEYACQFWIKHLLGIPGDSPYAEEVQEAIDKFFTVHLLHWIEVLALTRSLGTGVYAMNDIEQWYNLVSDMQIVHCKPILMVFKAGVVSKWTNDSQHFLLEHFDTIQNSCYIWIQTYQGESKRLSPADSYRLSSPERVPERTRSRVEETRDSWS